MNSAWWANRVEEENLDLETDKVREDIVISLTDNQYLELKLMGYKAGFDSVGDFLASFIGDLTGWHSNGSDERELADEWYERAFGHYEYQGYFMYHLFNYDYSLEQMEEIIDDMDYFEEVYNEYTNENESKDIQSKDDCLNTLKEIIKSGKEL